MTDRPDHQDPNRGPTMPRNAQPTGHQGAVVPPSRGGRSWHRPAIVAAAVIVVLLVLYLVA